jgi:hypothetical protein
MLIEPGPVDEVGDYSIQPYLNPVWVQILRKSMPMGDSNFVRVSRSSARPAIIVETPFAAVNNCIRLLCMLLPFVSSCYSGMVTRRMAMPDQALSTYLHCAEWHVDSTSSVGPSSGMPLLSSVSLHKCHQDERPLLYRQNIPGLQVIAFRVALDTQEEALFQLILLPVPKTRQVPVSVSKCPRCR